ITASLVAAAAGFASPATATTLSQAQQMCRKNPSCHETKDRAGGSNFNGNGPGGKWEITCPSNGDCVCLICVGPPARTQGGKDVRATVVGVMSSSAAVKPSKPSTTPGGVLGSGILESSPILGSQGPAATGSPATTPAAPAAPPPVIIR